MDASGRTSLGNLVLLALIAGAIYVAVMVTPYYVDHLDVKEAVAVAHNLATRNTDAVLRAEIRSRTQQMGEHWTTDEFGRDVLKRGLGLRDDQIFIERSDVTESIRIEVAYERLVHFRPTSYTYTLQFSAVKEGIPPR